MEGPMLASRVSCELEAATIRRFKLFKPKNRVMACLALTATEYKCVK